MLKKDTRNAELIDEQTKKLVVLQDTMSNLKRKYFNQSAEYEQYLSALRKRKESAHNYMKGVKRLTNNSHSSEVSNLTAISVKSRNTLQSLKSNMKCAEEIFRMHELNCKTKLIPRSNNNYVNSGLLPDHDNMNGYKQLRVRVKAENIQLEAKLQAAKLKNRELKTSLRKGLSGLAI